MTRPDSGDGETDVDTDLALLEAKKAVLQVRFRQPLHASLHAYAQAKA
jgi:hypothetical protein